MDADAQKDGQPGHEEILTLRTLVHPVALGVLGGLGLVCPMTIYLCYRLVTVVWRDW
jgi:hypothetical protein